LNREKPLVAIFEIRVLLGRLRSVVIFALLKQTLYKKHHRGASGSQCTLSHSTGE